jgi:hypothetical protein
MYKTAVIIMSRFAARQAVRPETYIVEQGWGDSTFANNSISKFVWELGCDVSQGCEATIPINVVS